MSKKTVIKIVVLIVFIAISIFAAYAMLRPKFTGIRAGKADENYIKSVDCKSCHTGHFESWDKTHHSKMTQVASSKAVVGDFTQTFEYLGVKAKMERNGEDFFINLIYPNGQTERNKIKYTIGSRRIQQYATEKDGKTIRLPIAWHIEQNRWMSLNGSFFYPDGNNFEQHRSQWDTNCVFCHNVKAQPNITNFQTLQAKTEVAEVGIACGSCHGQGAEHADQYNSIFAKFSNPKETKIVQPENIDSDKSLMICGHCHGQRTPADESKIREIMSKGDPYNAGDDLSKYYKPVHADTKIGNFSFASRFWADGSPRLTAYEYQGITASPCFINSKSDGKSEISGRKISCLSCHSMHDGDVKGMITEQMRTNQACNQCHTEFKDEQILVSHTKHDAKSAGSSCYSCHMPEVLYGVMDFHKSHQISVPKPVLTAEKDVPNACNQCHVDKSVNWAIEQTKINWQGYKDTQTVANTQFNQPAAIRNLFAGDSLTRALAAYAINKHGDINYFAPYLIESFSSENYPIVRYFVANALMKTGWNLEKPDYLADTTKRNQQIQIWLEKIEQNKLSEAKQTAENLRKLRKDVDVEVGE